MTEVVDKSWDLSLYELHRTPQEAITDTTEIAVSPKSLQSELTCPICLDMLTSTMTTKECLHRFCADCIITALRSGNKECPTCRKKLVSKRSLRPDPNFDQLVSKIFPDREEYEEQQEKVLAILTMSHSQQLMSTIGDAIKAQAAHVKMINRKKNLSDYDDLVLSPHIPGTPLNPGTPDPDSFLNDDNETTPYRPRKKKKPAVNSENGEGTSNAITDDEVEFIMKAQTSTLSPQTLDKIPLKYLEGSRFGKCSKQATVEHLIKFIKTRLELEANGDNESNGEVKKEPDEEGDEKMDEGGDAKPKEEKKKGVEVIDIKFHVSPALGQYIELTGPETLEMVLEDYWKTSSKTLELFYDFKAL